MSLHLCPFSNKSSCIKLPECHDTQFSSKRRVKKKKIQLKNSKYSEIVNKVSGYFFKSNYLRITPCNSICSVLLLGHTLLPKNRAGARGTIYLCTMSHHWDVIFSRLFNLGQQEPICPQDFYHYLCTVSLVTFGNTMPHQLGQCEQ